MMHPHIPDYHWLDHTREFHALVAHYAQLGSTSSIRGAGATSSQPLQQLMQQSVQQPMQPSMQQCMQKPMHQSIHQSMHQCVQQPMQNTLQPISNPTPPAASMCLSPLQPPPGQSPAMDRYVLFHSLLFFTQLQMFTSLKCKNVLSIIAFNYNI